MESSREHRVARLLLGLACLVLAAAASASPMFVPLGDLPGGEFSSFASAVSADGSTVVGGSYIGGSDEVAPFRRTSEGGMVPLGPPGFLGTAAGISADGTTVVGWSRSAATLDSLTSSDGLA
jgi:hypothetical protein